jgi:hypothetical protein
MAIFRPWKVIRDVFTAAEVEAIREPLLESPLVGRSTLGGSFRASRGFAVTFHGSGREQLEARFPYIAPFLAKAISAGRRKPNAWYLNLLLVPPGAGVGRHVDGTLRGPSGDEDAVPKVVSVLYLAAPGGALVLSRGAKELGRVAPREGTMVHFNGELDHAVEPFEGEGTRASLVLEQYHFGPAALARLPELKVDSRAGFQAYLDAHARVSR